MFWALLSPLGAHWERSLHVHYENASDVKEMETKREDSKLYIQSDLRYGKSKLIKEKNWKTFTVIPVKDCAPLPLQFVCRNPNPNRIFGGWRLGHETGAPMMCALLRGDMRACFLSLLSATWGRNDETAICKTGIGRSPDTRPGVTLILDFHPPELWETNVWFEPPNLWCICYSRLNRLRQALSWNAGTLRNKPSLFSLHSDFIPPKNIIFKRCFWVDLGSRND